MNTKLPSLWQLPAMEKLPEMGKLPEIKFAMTTEQGNLMVTAPYNSKTRTVVTSLSAAAIFAGVAANSKNGVWKDIFGLAALCSGGYAIYTANQD